MNPAARPQPAPIQQPASSHVLPDVLCHASLIGDDEISRQLRADLTARAEAGVQKYGTPLTTHNGRNALMDCYQEVLDAAMYARQASLEAEDMDVNLWTLYEDALFHARRLRVLLNRRP